MASLADAGPGTDAPDGGPRRRGRWLAPAVRLAIAAAAVGPAPAGAQVQTIANLVVGDGVMVIKAAAGKRVLVGVGSATRTSTLTFAAPAVDQFVAEAQQLVRRGTRPLPASVPDHPILEETLSARSLSVTRHVSRRGSTPRLAYHFFVSDERLTGFALSASPVETRDVLLALHRAARSANSVGATADSARAGAARHGTRAPGPTRQPR